MNLKLCKMKITILATLIIASFACKAQLNLKSIKEKAKSSVRATDKVPLTNDEIVAGLKDALNVGIDKAAYFEVTFASPSLLLC